MRVKKVHLHHQMIVINDQLLTPMRESFMASIAQLVQKMHYLVVVEGWAMCELVNGVVNLV